MVPPARRDSPSAAISAAVMGRASATPGAPEPGGSVPGSPVGALEPDPPVPGPPEGERSRPGSWASPFVHSPTGPSNPGLSSPVPSHPGSFDPDPGIPNPSPGATWRA
jgi:hypothetical protein